MMGEKKSKIRAFFFVILFMGSLFMDSLFALAIERPNIEYKEEGLRDPFQSPIKEEVITEVPQEQVPTEPLPPLTIQGVVWGGILPQAIINNKVVKIGDTIEGVQIMDIDKSSITVSFGNQKYNLSSPAAVSLGSPKPRPEGDNGDNLEGGNDEE